MISKKGDITLGHECFAENCLDIVTTYSFCFKTSAEKSPWTKIYYMQNCLNTSILAAMECAACVCFFFENREFGKKSTQIL